MATEAELRAVFAIFKNDQGLVLEATRALDWAAERAAVSLTAEERCRFSFALAAGTTVFAAGGPGVVEIQCASKGCTGGGNSGTGGPPTG